MVRVRITYYIKIKTLNLTLTTDPVGVHSLSRDVIIAWLCHVKLILAKSSNPKPYANHNPNLNRIPNHKPYPYL